MGPYCNYCGHRCFVRDPRRSGWLLATCAPGQAHDRAVGGYAYDDVAPAEVVTQ